MEPDYYFLYDKKSFNVAKRAMAKMKTETQVLEYLMESRPPCLRVGDVMMGLDLCGLEKQVEGIADKLIINGFSERGERLSYLYKILSKKMAEKEDFLKISLRFLLEMSERPTSLLRLEIGTKTYSELPDSEETMDENKAIKERELLIEIMGEDFQQAIVYSSESELSDWSTDEESPHSKTSNNEIAAPDTNIRQSATFSDFSATNFPLDDDSKQREIDMYWAMEKLKAKLFLSTLDHQSSLQPLCHEPVISGLLTLHTKFGEYWEWKQAASNGSSRTICPESIVIQEVLWQFSIINPDASQIFTAEWDLIPGLMTPSLTHVTLSVSMQPVLKGFKTLHLFKNFVQQIFHKFSSLEHSPELPISKILLSYAQGLSDIINYISKTGQSIDGSIKTVSKKNPDKRYFSLLKVIKTLTPMLNCLSMLNEVHSTTFCPLTELSYNVPEQEAMSCLLIFNNLAERLDQTSPMKFGWMFFLFLKCLHTFLEEINGSLSLNWSKHLLFQRFPEINLSDENFWIESIKQCNYAGSSTILVDCVANLVSEVTIILKTAVMLQQLEENVTEMLGTPPNSQKIISNFVKLLFTSIFNDTDHTSSENVVPHPDYETHLKYLGMENSLEADSFRTILSGHIEPLFTSKPLRNPTTQIGYLFTLQNMPTINHWDALKVCLNEGYNQICVNSRNCITKIFHDHKVGQSLKIFREIILEAREDFAQSVISLVSDRTDKSTQYKWEDHTCKNPGFQKLLNDCYLEGRENFEITLKIDRTTTTNYTLVVKPYFPLNLILIEDSINSYLYVSRQLSRLRKTLWELNDLNIKDFKVIEGTEPYRVLLFRYSLLIFCSSLRTYFILKIFGKEFHLEEKNYSHDLDIIRKEHWEHLRTIETELLRNPIIDQIILTNTQKMSEKLTKLWKSGIPSKTILSMEDSLKKCWRAIHHFRKSSSNCEIFNTCFSRLQ